MNLPEEAAVLSMYFINQTAPDIRRKIQKLAKGPQTPQAQLLEIIGFGVFNNRDLVKAEKEYRKSARDKEHA